MKISKKLCGIFIAVIMLAGINPLHAEASLDYYDSHEYVWADGIEYEIAYDNIGIAVEVVGYNKNEIGADVVIPNKVPGTDYTVNYIGNYAFACNKTIKTLTIEGSQKIYSNAFMACTNLEKVTFNQVSDYAMDVCGGAFSGCSSLKEFIVNSPEEEFDYHAGQLVVIDGGLYCYTNTDDYTYEFICYPEARNGTTFTLASKSTYDSWMNGNLLMGNSNITTIVSNDTEHYQVQDGVLFSSDMTKLYCYPAGKTDAAYAIPESVTEIAEGAFYNASNLNTLYIPDSVTTISGTRDTLPWYYSIGVLETSSNCTIVADDGVVGANGAETVSTVCYKMCQPNYDLMIHCGSQSIVYDVAKAMSGWAETNDYGLNINDVWYLKNVASDNNTISGNTTINGATTNNTTNSTVVNQPISLKKQSIITAKIKTYKAKALKKTKKTFKLEAETSGDGRLTYKVTKGKSKYITISTNGKVTLKKGCKKGKYKITIKAAQTSNYKAAIKVITVIVK